MGDYLLMNISKRGIISCRFLSFFPINPEARQAVSTAMWAPTLSLVHNGGTDPVLISMTQIQVYPGEERRQKRQKSLSLSLLNFLCGRQSSSAYWRPHDHIDQTYSDQLMVT